jgi:hypothetical protein
MTDSITRITKDSLPPEQAITRQGFAMDCLLLAYQEINKNHCWNTVPALSCASQKNTAGT